MEDKGYLLSPVEIQDLHTAVFLKSRNRVGQRQDMRKIGGEDFARDNRVFCIFPKPLFGVFFPYGFKRYLRNSPLPDCNSNSTDGR